MKSSKYWEHYQNVIQRHEVSTCYRKNGADRLTRRSVAQTLNLPKKAIYAKRNKTRYTCILEKKRKKHNFSETASFSVLRWEVGDIYSVWSLRSLDRLCQYNYSCMNTWDQAMSMGDNRKICKKNIVIYMHRPETKTEKEVKILCNKLIQLSHEDGKRSSFWNVVFLYVI
jgi:hypothetical protein